MKRITLLLMSVLLYATSAWAIDVTVGPSTGTYYDTNGNPNPTTIGWGPTWKSTATALDGTTPLLTFTGQTGMNINNGNIFPSTYTLEVPAGYVISSYTLNGTAAGGDVTITPSGESATVISNGNSLSEALAVTVRAQSTSFVLAGGHLENVKLNVTVSPTPVIVAMTSTGKLPSAYGAFSGQTFTTAAASGLAGVTITASSGLSINEATVDGDNYGKCFSLVTEAAATNYTVTMTAPEGYVITGYYLGCSANTKDAVHTLTSADGSVSVVASAPPYNNPAYAPKVFEVTGLNTNSTYFTINTANSANTLYLPTFCINVAKASEVVDVTYNVMFNGSQVATTTINGRILGSTPALPSSLVKDYCTYAYYSDEACTEEITKLTSATVYVKCTFSPPFTVSTSFADATWYYATIRDTKYLRADDSAKDSYGRYSTNSSNGLTDVYKWAFFGNPYALYIANKGQGEGKYLNAGSAVPNFVQTNTPATTTATLWEAITNGDGFNLRSLTKPNLYINDASNTGNLGYWDSTSGRADAGGKWVVTKEFDALIALLEAIPFGTGVNQYRLVVESIDYTSQVAEIISGIKAKGFTADNLATAQQLLASATLNLPAAGFYRIKGKTSGNYLAAGKVNNKYAMSSATDATTIFYYDGTKVVNFSSGMANGMSTSSWDWKTGDAASTVVFADGGSNGGYTFKSANAFFYDGGDNADRGSSLNDNARYRNWYLTEVTTLPVTISAAGYATFNSPVAVEIPQGITAYQASVQDADYIRLVSIDDGVIPANFPVVLKGNPGPYTFNITTTELTEGDYHANELKGSIAAKSVSAGEIYTLQRDSETTVGFYPNAGTTFKGFSAYLTSASGSRGFQMVSSTGIEHIATPILFENAYDLQGRKAGIVKKGVYIVNGKKVLF